MISWFGGSWTKAPTNTFEPTTVTTAHDLVIRLRTEGLLREHVGEKEIRSARHGLILPQRRGIANTKLLEASFDEYQTTF